MHLASSVVGTSGRLKVQRLIEVGQVGKVINLTQASRANCYSIVKPQPSSALLRLSHQTHSIPKTRPSKSQSVNPHLTTHSPTSFARSPPLALALTRTGPYQLIRPPRPNRTRTPPSLFQQLTQSINTSFTLAQATLPVQPRTPLGHRPHFLPGQQARRPHLGSAQAGQGPGQARGG